MLILMDVGSELSLQLKWILQEQGLYHLLMILQSSKICVFRYIQYVIQIGSTSPSTGCRIFQGSAGNSNASVLLQYSTNNGITWNLLREHRARYFGTARRLSVVITEEVEAIFVKGHFSNLNYLQVKSPQTIIRWVQPYHHATGYDQWAVDNVEVVM